MADPADQYKRLVDASPDGILVVRNSRIEFLNPAAVRLLGAATPGEVLGKSPFDMLHADGHSVIRERIERRLRGETLPPIEARSWFDGGVTDVEFNATLLDSSDGGSIQLIVRDIGERKRREAALRESEERLMLAFAGAQEGVWDWNLETGAVVYSPRWKQMLGYEDDEIPPTVAAWERLLHPDDRSSAERSQRAAVGGRPSYEGEFRLRHKGHYITVLTRLPSAAKPTDLSCASSARISTSPKVADETALRESEEPVTRVRRGRKASDWNPETDAVVTPRSGSRCWARRHEISRTSAPGSGSSTRMIGPWPTRRPRV
jgi:PAS domain S-box-containing protein